MSDKKKIIAVDDNPENLGVLKNTLKDLYMVYPCPSAAQMFDLLEHVQPELILLDIEMPEMNGYEAIKKLKNDFQNKYKDIPVIFLTSMTDAQSEIEGLSYGAVDYIHKPFNALLLLQRIRTQLSFYELQTEIKHLLDLNSEEIKLREKAEQEAHSASAAMSGFLSNVNHGIRSSLNVVIGMINIANEEKTIEGVQVYLEKAGNAADHMLSVIDDILDMSKIEADKLKISGSEFDSGKMMTSIDGKTSTNAQEKHIKTEDNTGNDIPSATDSANATAAAPVPASAPAPAPVAAPAPVVPIIRASDLHLQGYTILAAEDMEFNREVLSKYLEKTGVTIDFAENGKEAIEKFKVNYEKYCLILMDIVMPQMDGDEAAKIIRALDIKKAKEIPIIAMTAEVFKEDIEKCLSAGMNDHISKPIVPKVIYAKIKQQLGL